MTLNKYEAFDILYRNKVIYEMCIEDIDLCKDLRVRPAFVRFPECFDFSIGGFINEDKEKARFRRIIKDIKTHITKILGFNYIDSQTNRFLTKRKKLLEIHLQRLRRLRDKRLNYLGEKT